MLKLKNTLFAVVSLALLVTTSLPGLAQDTTGKKTKDTKVKNEKTYTGPALLWSEPADIESRNLLLGAGSETAKPDLSRVTFIEQKTGGYSTKYRVRDAAGKEWIAKIGKESQPDTAANRLLWAVGYKTEVAYLVPKLTIEGKGIFENVRLEARPKSIDRTGNWLWASNPFVGKPEFQGLKIMMALINNWDLKDDNNEILATRDALDSERHFIISDLGGSFGKTGGFISRSRNNPSDYVKADFVKAVKGNRVDFNYGGKNKKLFEDVTVQDAKWMGNWLSRLSDEQIKDAFRAANYPPEDVERLARAVRERIDALTKISTSVAAN